ncbi:MAG TPA: hypothetical protein H9671_06535 [Firmicutes bacterium]|nr:hypothetical protein [Bacillota bacterium]
MKKLLHPYISKSIDFLLENAGPVIQYRLRKEILNDLSESDEEKLLEQIYALPLFQSLATYVKPGGYIGTGMHSWDHWRGTVLHRTPLEDGECAARLLSYYRIPKTHIFVKGFVAAMRDQETLRKEFSYIPPEIPRYESRFKGLNNGNCLMALIYTMEAMLGYGDDYEDLKAFQQTSLKGFQRVHEISSLDDVTRFNANAKRKYNYPYIEADEYFPNIYTVAMLAYTQSWRTDENIQMLAASFNHINAIMQPGNNIHVRINGKYVAPCFALVRPIRAFHPDLIDSITYRRLLTEIAMMGVGESVEVIRESVANVKEAIDKDGVLRMNFGQPHNKRYSPKYIEYPTAYTDVRLESDYKNKKALLCDLTYWAVEFLVLADRSI